jgi:hypothetical protein
MITDLKNDQKKLKDIEALIEEKVIEEINKSTAEITNLLEKHINKAITSTSEFLETGKSRREEVLANEKKEEEEKNKKYNFIMPNPFRKRNPADNVQDALTSNDKIKYKDKCDAEELLNAIGEEIRGITAVLFSDAEKALQTSIKSLQKSLNDKVKNDLAEVLEQAKERLQDQGIKVNFKLPQLDGQSNISFTMEDFVSSGIKKHTYSKKRTRVKDSFYSKGVNFLNNDWGRESYATTKTDYKVDILAIKKKIEGNMQKLKQTVKNSQMDFLEYQLKEKINQQINNVQEYLERYRGDLMQGIKDQQTDSKKK